VRSKADILVSVIYCTEPTRKSGKQNKNLKKRSELSVSSPPGIRGVSPEEGKEGDGFAVKEGL